MSPPCSSDSQTWPRITVTSSDKPQCEGSYEVLYAGRRQVNGRPVWAMGTKRIYSYTEGSYEGGLNQSGDLSATFSDVDSQSGGGKRYWAMAVGADAPFTGKKVMHSIDSHSGYLLPCDMRGWVSWDSDKEEWIPAKGTFVRRAGVPFSVSPVRSSTPQTDIPTGNISGLVLNPQMKIEKIEPEDAPAASTNLKLGDTIVWVRDIATERTIVVDYPSIVEEICGKARMVQIGYISGEKGLKGSCMMQLCTDSPRSSKRSVSASPTRSLSPQVGSVQQSTPSGWLHHIRDVPITTDAVGRVTRRRIFRMLDTSESGSLNLQDIQRNGILFAALGFTLPPFSIPTAFNATTATNSDFSRVIEKYTEASHISLKTFKTFLLSLRRQMQLFAIFGTKDRMMEISDIRRSIPLLIEWNATQLDANIIVKESSNGRNSCSLIEFVGWSIRQGLDIATCRSRSHSTRLSKVRSSSACSNSSVLSALTSNSTSMNGINSFHRLKSSKMRRSFTPPPGWNAFKNDCVVTLSNGMVRSAAGWEQYIQLLPCSNSALDKARRRGLFSKIDFEREGHIQPHDLSQGLMDVLKVDIGAAHNTATATAIATSHRIACSICGGPIDGTVDRKLFKNILQSLSMHFQFFQVLGAFPHPIGVSEFQVVQPLVRSWGLELPTDPLISLREAGAGLEQVPFATFCSWIISKALLLSE